MESHIVKQLALRRANRKWWVQTPGKGHGKGSKLQVLGMERREETVLWQFVRTEHRWAMAMWELEGEAWDLGHHSSHRIH